MEPQAVFVKNALGVEQFRIIEILPSRDFDAEIKCISHIVSLDEEPEYETLSYVWGDPTVTKPILLDGENFQVTTNLESALRHIRKSWPRLLWVDAVCINQIDHLEKAHQINLMGELYRKSRRGLTWFGDLESLGINAEQSVKAIEVLKMLASRRHMEDRCCFEDVLVWDGGFRAIHSLITCPWWDRIWTVQEAVLPPAAMVVWGRFSISWETLEKVFHHLMECWPVLDGTLNASCDLNVFTVKIAGLIFIKNEPTMEPTSCLQRFRNRKATDPRDMVLGLLGLLPHWSIGIEPGFYYGLDTAQLFQQTAISLIRHSSSLCSMIGHRGELAVTPNLASWATDWIEQPKSNQLLRVNRYYSHMCRWWHFRANADEKVVMEIGPEENTLSLGGVFIDTISAIGEPFMREVQEYLNAERQHEKIKQWLELSEEHKPADESYISGGTWENAFWRTIIGDVMDTDGETNLPSRRATEEDGQAFKEYVEGSFGIGSDIELSIQDHTINQVFFITNLGYMGVGPGTLKTGDEIWVLYGGRLPFTLRRRIEEKNNTDPPDSAIEMEDDEPAHFEFIGDVYVHGIMDGEAMEGHEKTVCGIMNGEEIVGEIIKRTENITQTVILH